MNKPAIINYLKADSKVLGNLLTKLNRLHQWNAWLTECLPQETTLLEHCRIAGLDKTSLIVIADNPHWVTRFRFFIPDLVIKLKNYPDFKNIVAICCKVRPQFYANVGRNKKARPLVMSSENAAVLREHAQKISDKKLREAMERLAENGLSDNEG